MSDREYICQSENVSDEDIDKGKYSCKLPAYYDLHQKIQDVISWLL